MGKRKLALVKYYHSQSTDDAIAANKGKESVLLVFNRPLHPLEAMGVAHLVQEDLKRTD
jgi:hypothetical protein